MPPAQRAEYDRQIAALQTSLNETALAVAWQRAGRWDPIRRSTMGLHGRPPHAPPRAMTSRERSR